MKKIEYSVKKLSPDAFEVTITKQTHIGNKDFHSNTGEIFWGSNGFGLDSVSFLDLPKGNNTGRTVFYLLGVRPELNENNVLTSKMLEKFKVVVAEYNKFHADEPEIAKPRKPCDPCKWIITRLSSGTKYYVRRESDGYCDYFTDISKATIFNTRSEARNVRIGVEKIVKVKVTVEEI